MVRGWIRRDLEGNCWPSGGTTTKKLTVRVKELFSIFRVEGWSCLHLTGWFFGLFFDPWRWSVYLQKSVNLYGSARCWIVACLAYCSTLKLGSELLRNVRKHLWLRLLFLCLVYSWTLKTLAVNYSETSVDLYGCACLSFTALFLWPWRRRQYDLRKCW
jgi:hypothetical protein